MLEGLSIDPYDVLGLERGASLDAVREAFHAKSKKHHPDHGGDGWAFRIVVRAYERLTTELTGLSDSSILRSPITPGGSGAMRSPVGPHEEPSPSIRHGAYDREMHPTRLVQVEIVRTRVGVDDVIALLSHGQGERDLSGSMNVQWPDASVPGDPRAIPFADRILVALNAAFDDLRAKTQPVSAQSNIDHGRFQAWLRYPTGAAAGAAFKHLHVNLRARGLGARQWTRDVTVPR